MTPRTKSGVPFSLSLSLFSPFSFKWSKLRWQASVVKYKRPTGLAYTTFNLTLSNLLPAIPWAGKLESNKTAIYWERDFNTWSTQEHKKRSSLTVPSSSESLNLCISQLETPYGCQARGFTFPDDRPGAWHRAVTGVQESALRMKKKKQQNKTKKTTFSLLIPNSHSAQVTPSNATRMSPHMSPRSPPRKPPPSSTLREPRRPYRGLCWP